MATSSAVASTLWDVVGSDVATPFLVASSAGGAPVGAASVAGKLSCVLNLKALTPSSSYTLRLRATDAAGATGAATVAFLVNDPPASGTSSVSPPNGYALFTSFTIETLNWVDEDLPLTYVFGTVPVYLDGIGETILVDASASALAPFGGSRGDASLSGVTLSAGKPKVNFTVGCFASAVDSFGARGTATAMTRARPKSLTTAQLFNISEAKAKEALDAGNADSAKQVLTATTDGMKATATAEGARRRSLLALGSSALAESRALRAAVLANLWSTYAITPLTDDDVASLLGVLAGVVDTPAEVDGATAASALCFLDTLLRAALRAPGVGLGGGGGDSVAAAVGSLAAAPSRLFNASLSGGKGSSGGVLDLASNATWALGAAAALRLSGESEGATVALAGTGVSLYAYVARAAGPRRLAWMPSLYQKKLSMFAYMYYRCTIVLVPVHHVLVSAPYLRYRAEVGGLSGGGSLADGEAADVHTSVAISATAASELNTYLRGFGAGSSAVDVRIHTLDENIFAAALKGTAGSAAAVASRLDQSAQGGVGTVGPFLLRSKLTTVELAWPDASDPLKVSGLASPLEVTIGATIPFTVDTSAFEKSFSCAEDGRVVDLKCPWTPDSHTCNFAAHGGGSKYLFDYSCPRVVPTCLWWDAAADGFSSAGCTVVEGYSAEAVTCSCSHLTTFALGANATQPAFSARVTSAPSPAPSPLPSPSPTRTPTSRPSPTPTPLPTTQSQHPTPRPSAGPTAPPTPLPAPRPSLEPSPIPLPAPTADPTTLPTFCIDRSPYCVTVTDYCATVSLLTRLAVSCILPYDKINVTFPFLGPISNDVLAHLPGHCSDVHRCTVVLRHVPPGSPLRLQLRLVLPAHLAADAGALAASLLTAYSVAHQQALSAAHAAAGPAPDAEAIALTHGLAGAAAHVAPNSTTDAGANSKAHTGAHARAHVQAHARAEPPSDAAADVPPDSPLRLGGPGAPRPVPSHDDQCPTQHTHSDMAWGCNVGPYAAQLNHAFHRRPGVVAPASRRQWTLSRPPRNQALCGVRARRLLRGFCEPRRRILRGKQR